MLDIERIKSSLNVTEQSINSKRFMFSSDDRRTEERYSERMRKTGKRENLEKIVDEVTSLEKRIRITRYQGSCAIHVKSVSHSKKEIAFQGSLNFAAPAALFSLAGENHGSERKGMDGTVCSDNPPDHWGEVFLIFPW
jgi:hypothetical protein